MEFPKPTKEHQWLQQLLGDWTYEGEGGEHKFTGTERVRAIGDLWIVAEGSGEMGTTIFQLGFDPRKGRFVGSWIGSMMDYLWVYDGELDASGKILALNSDGPGFEDPNVIESYQDVHEIVSPDLRILHGRLKQKDGSYQEFMNMHMHRVK